MVDEHKTLDQTGAGQELAVAIQKERARFARELKEVQEQMQEAVRERDKESERAMRELQDDYSRRMQELENDRSELKISIERMHEERYSKLEQMLKAQQEAHARELEELRRQARGTGEALVKRGVGNADSDTDGQSEAMADDASSINSSQSIVDLPKTDTGALHPSTVRSSTVKERGRYMDVDNVSFALTQVGYCLIGPHCTEW
jgi:DNA repair exonuclease SbcCD ATPase subunit